MGSNKPELFANKPVPFRIGTTSYIIPAEIVPNVEFLAPLVDDIQLVLFETDEYGSNLPGAGEICYLQRLAAEYGLTYTVHLPLDLTLGDRGAGGHISLLKARRVIEATQDLDPRAYTVHLDGEPLLEFSACGDSRSLAGFSLQARVDRWLDNSAQALQIVSGWLNVPLRLSIENVEAWDPEFFAPLLTTLPISRTIDVGHLWLQGADPLQHLEQWIDRTLVVHLHGIAARDHASLAHVAPTDLDRVVSFLMQRFTGVVTLEVFNLADLTSSLEALDGAIGRIAGGI